VAPLPQFTFKNTLALSSFSTNTVDAYAFNSGEEVRFIPTTAKQVSDFISILAVSGITTLGTVSTSNREGYLQLLTQTLGSEGAVKVSGGSASASVANIIGSAIPLVGTDLIQMGASKSATSGLASNMWVKLEAANSQPRVTDVSETTNVVITPNTPTAITSIIELEDRGTRDRYFGIPKNQIRDVARAFHVEKHGSLVNISWDGITGTDPLFTKTVEINDSALGNMQVIVDTASSSTEFVITSGSRSFIEVSVGDSLTTQNFINSENNGTFIVNGVSDDGLTVSVEHTGLDATGSIVSAGDTVFTTDMQEGDLIEIGEPFSSLNRGIFRVIRKFNNSFYIENDSVVEERVFGHHDFSS